MNGKQRAFLRRQANSLDTTFQIGKNGLTDHILKQYDDILEAREIVKTHVLKSCEMSPKELAEAIAERTGSMIVSVVGRRFVLFRISDKLQSAGKGILLPR